MAPSQINKKKKAIIFGCQQIAVDLIDFLLKKNVEIPLVVTYELPLDQTYGYASVIEFCKNRNLNFFAGDRITDSMTDWISEQKPDFIFSFYYRKILPKSLLAIAKDRAINIHPSLLPHYRGPVPTAWAIENGEKEVGVTIHLMDGGIDTGDILIQKRYPIGENETGYELYTRAMTLGTDLFRKNYDKIASGKIKPYKQEGVGSYYGKKSGRYILDWKRKAEDIRNLIRVYAKPFNMAETKLFNRYVLVNRAKVLKDKKYPAQGAGRIMDILPGEKLLVSCADGCLLLEDYQFAPKLTPQEKKIYLKIGNRFE